MRIAKRLGIAALCAFFAGILLYGFYLYGSFYATPWRAALPYAWLAGCAAVPTGAGLGIASLCKRIKHANPFRAKKRRVLRSAGWIAAFAGCAGALFLTLLMLALPVVVGFLTAGWDFKPYQSPSPDGQYNLDVRCVRDERGNAVSAEFSVLDAETGEPLYGCPGMWRTWDLWGIDWLCDGTVLVDSSDVGKMRYGPDEDGVWAELDSSAAPSGMPISRNDHLQVYMENGWRAVAIAGNPPSLMSFDAEGKLRLDTDHHRANYAQLAALLKKGDYDALRRLRMGWDADGAARYVTRDAYDVTMKGFEILSAEKLF
ncbi:MAG: hypothetical protein GX592_11245 [Clostridiales bacterium]|nr:hypothetical protein [Clostridiales bacterium]